jgi:carboxyl-terminal processing protease
MQDPRKPLAQGFIVLLIVGAAFLVGMEVGKNERPAAQLVTGIIGERYPTTTSPSEEPGLNELTICVDKKGVEVPCILNGNASSTKKNGDTPANFDEFWKAWNVINERFVPTKHKPVITNQEKVWGAIQGLAASLGDPYTYFLPPQEKQIFEEDVRGSFGGVGMQIGMKDGLLTVIAPLKASPAERAGIKAGDRILKIDDATTTGMSVDKALYLIRGEIGKAVTLSLYRDGAEEPYVVTIIREEIKVPTIDGKKDGDIYVISLYGFPATGADLFRQELRNFVLSGSNKLILDLRGNPGGYLEIAVDMASWFLPAGKVVVSEQDRNGEGVVYRSRGYDVFGPNLKMVILVDGGTASAAEILAGALSQHGVAKLMGTKTFGKGSVQELVPITDDTALKITVARWITPNGTSLSDGGLVPDFEIDISKEDIEAGRDPQLDAAKEYLRTGKVPAVAKATTSEKK